MDALGAAWDPEAFMETEWTAETWAQSPWAPLVTEVSGSTPAPATTGSAAPLLAWDPSYWGTHSPQEAGWDARYWGARYWGARYWGTDAWQ